MAVVADTEVHDIEAIGQPRRIPPAGSAEIARRHRHQPDRWPTTSQHVEQRCVAVGIAIGSDPLIDLEHRRRVQGTGSPARAASIARASSRR